MIGTFPCDWPGMPATQAPAKNTKEKTNLERTPFNIQHLSQDNCEVAARLGHSEVNETHFKDEISLFAVT